MRATTELSVILEALDEAEDLAHATVEFGGQVDNSGQMIAVGQPAQRIDADFQARLGATTVRPTARSSC